MNVRRGVDGRRSVRKVRLRKRRGSRTADPLLLPGCQIHVAGGGDQTPQFPDVPVDAQFRPSAVRRSAVPGLDVHASAEVPAEADPRRYDVGARTADASRGARPGRLIDPGDGAHHRHHQIRWTWRAERHPGLGRHRRGGTRSRRFRRRHRSGTELAATRWKTGATASPGWVAVSAGRRKLAAVFGQPPLGAALRRPGQPGVLDQLGQLGLADLA